MVQTLISLIIIPIRGHFWFRESGPKQQKCKILAKAQVRETGSEIEKKLIHYSW